MKWHGSIGCRIGGALETTTFTHSVYNESKNKCKGYHLLFKRVSSPAGCDFLDLPRPEPSQADEDLNAYVIDKAVRYIELDGSTTTNFIDL